MVTPHTRHMCYVVPPIEIPKNWGLITHAGLYKHKQDLNKAGPVEILRCELSVLAGVDRARRHTTGPVGFQQGAKGYGSSPLCSSA